MVNITLRYFVSSHPHWKDKIKWSVGLLDSNTGKEIYTSEITEKKKKKSYVSFSQAVPKLYLSWDMYLNGVHAVPKICNLTSQYKTRSTIKSLAKSSQRAALWRAALVVLASESKFG